MPACPFCRTDAAATVVAGGADVDGLDCPRCGQFEITRTGARVASGLTNNNEKQMALLSHAIRNMRPVGDMKKGAPLPRVTSQWVEDVLKNKELPSVPELASNFILWLGDSFETPEETMNVNPESCSAIIGAVKPATVRYVAKHLGEEGYIYIDAGRGLENIALTAKGWARYEELHRTARNSRKAFMAMPFGYEDLNRMFETHYAPAVGRAGYRLERLDNPAPPAGLIDSRMRIAIRTARFLVVELTHNNCGAYWEAGFAEGLGKPVIYCCERRFFEEQRTHFDTNHHHTICWTADALDKAARELTDTIRATLPDEAKIED